MLSFSLAKVKGADGKGIMLSDPSSRVPEDHVIFHTPRCGYISTNAQIFFSLEQPRVSLIRLLVRSTYQADTISGT